jgi:glycosyltransferase involved in cell wall biosynthesis
LVLLPYADYALYAMALKGSPFRGAPWTGICMRPNFHQRAAGVAGARWGLAPQVQGWLYHRLARDPCLLRLFVIDETFFESSAVGTKLAAKSSLLPEPADDIAAGEDSSYNFGNIAAGDFVILMYGAISERKGLSKLLAALASPSMPPEVKVLISGRQDASARVAIERALLMNPSLRSRIACNDFYHSAVQEATCFMRADVVWLNYEGHLGMSGVLVQAARYQKPVISCADGVLGWHTKRKALGVVLPARAAPEEIAQVVRAMRADESGRVMMGLRGARAFQANSTDDFQWRLFSTLQPLLGEGL